MSRPTSSPSQGKDGEIITILLVDDIPETRENIKKLLAFEPDFKVVGSVGTGREGVALAKELRPNIVIMDINMPDMDGIQATTLITEAVPTAAVIMMSVQNDPDYLRRAMLAGARNFLTKPIDTDELYNTIRTVHARNKPLVRQWENQPPPDLRGAVQMEGTENRPGHIIVVYSPQGGAGCTTVATNLASGLMEEGIRVLLLDADLQFGDVGVFLNLQAQTTLSDLAVNVEDLDTEFFENAVVTHDSGLKVLLGPPRPELADEVRAKPDSVAQILEKVAGNYDYIIVDTSRLLDELLVAVMDIASKIILIATPTLASVKNVRFVLELFDKLEYPKNKTIFVLNRTQDDGRGRVTIPVEVIEKHLRCKVAAQIPLDEKVVLSAVNKGIPVIVAERDRRKSPVKELLGLADTVRTALATVSMDEEQEQADKTPSINLLRRR